MRDYQQAFLRFAIEQQVLRFGQFTLKSGRQSPYFFNAGLFNTGYALAQLGRYYAAAIQAHGIAYDVLFGPAYKGIPLVATTAIALAEHYQEDKPFCFNRKEVKQHGEGGQMVGAAVQGKILLIDDVITAGTAIRESQQLLHGTSAQLVGAVIALDRQERGQGELSAIQELEREYGLQIIPIVTLTDIIAYLQQQSDMQAIIPMISAYQAQYGIR